ncbi:MAG: cytochrome c-type biogenesis protein CcmH [Anaerolineales bacterium]|nr:cytochrome c-type biogenesis protein CcmH [Anaerolineales bacterium]
MKRFVLLFLSLLVLALSLAGPAGAQGNGPSDDQVNAIAKQLYCPVCENIPLDVCGTQACEQWRDLIRQKLAEGWSEDQIKQYFVDQYGDRVLAAPPPRGFNWLVYVVPPLAILAGLYVLYRAFRSWRPRPEEAAVGEPPVDLPDDYVARLEEEVQNR